MTTSEVRELSQPDRGRRRALAQKQRPASAARRETVWEFVVAGYEHELIAQKLGVRRRPITTEAIGSAATHPSLRGALATKQSRSHNMRGASNPNDRTAAPGLLPATRVRGRNDGQGIGSLVSACRLSLATVRREVDKAIDRLDAPDRHIHPTSPNLETAPCAVDDALERADLNAADPPLQGDGAVERHHGPTVAAPSRSQPPQLSSLERGGKLSCPQSLENTQNRKIHETAPGAVDDALERADLDPADPPLAGGRARRSGRAIRLGAGTDRSAGWASPGIDPAAIRDGRLDFQRLVAEVGLGNVGLVLGIEMSRLARFDWHQLLEICALFDTLIADANGVYDPAHYNDRLLLGLKGTMSEAELHILKARMLAGRKAKAGRGQLGKPVPMGYVRRPSGEVAFDPPAYSRSFRRLMDCGLVLIAFH